MKDQCNFLDGPSLLLIAGHTGGFDLPEACVKIPHPDEDTFHD